MAQGDALNLSELAIEILNSTAITPPRAGAISDQVARTEDGFVIFIDQLRIALGRLLRTAARDGIETISAPIIVQRGLDGAASLWQELARVEGEVDGLNLDQRAAILLLIEQLRTA
jgi:DNA polymerase-3 subunit delta'